MQDVSSLLDKLRKGNLPNVMKADFSPSGSLTGLMTNVCVLQTFNLVVVSNANGTIVSSALSYWQNLAPNGGGIAVGLIVEVCVRLIRIALLYSLIFPAWKHQVTYERAASSLQQRMCYYSIARHTCEVQVYAQGCEAREECNKALSR